MTSNKTADNDIVDKVKQTPNKPLTKTKRRKQVLDATMDCYRVKSLRGRVEEQMKRFEDMSKGGKGGFLRPTHTECIRDMHYKRWRNEDFKKLLRELRKAIAEVDAAENDSTSRDS